MTSFNFFFHNTAFNENSEKNETTLATLITYFITMKPKYEPKIVTVIALKV